MTQFSRLFIFLSFFVSFTITPEAALAFPGKFSVSPDSSQELLLETIQSAKQNINLNVYMISNVKLLQALLDQFNRGVVLNVLIEAEPFGGKITEAEKKFLDTLSTAFQQSTNKLGKSHVYIFTSQHGAKKRRYVYDHAKYITIDGKRAYVSSENFVTSSAMADPGKRGNRGWQVLIDDLATAKNLDNLFTGDIDPSFGDVVEYDPSLVATMPPPPPRSPNSPQPPSNDRTVQSFPVGTGDISSASICASPNSLNCMVDFMRSAKQSLVIEHLSLPMNWSGNNSNALKNGSGDSTPGSSAVLNPIITEAIAAAKRGVKVRIIINASGNGSKPNTPNATIEAPNASLEDSLVLAKNPPKPPKSPKPPKTPKQDPVPAPSPSPNPDSSQAVVDYIKSVAHDQHLSLDATIINIQGLELNVLHNKGMVADNVRAWVSSINATDNSVMNNREVAVRLESSAAARYYSDVFELDWQKSAVAQ